MTREHHASRFVFQMTGGSCDHYIVYGKRVRTIIIIITRAMHVRHYTLAHIFLIFFSCCGPNGKMSRSRVTVQKNRTASGKFPLRSYRVLISVRRLKHDRLPRGVIDSCSYHLYIIVLTRVHISSDIKSFGKKAQRIPFQTCPQVHIIQSLLKLPA